MSISQNKFLKHVRIDYDFSFIYDLNWNQYEHNCIGHQQIELKDIYDTFGGFPSSYTPHNTTFYQKFFEKSEINFDALGNQVGVEPISISMIKLPPGMITILHRDTFYRINKDYPDDSRMRVRANIFLEDWKWGHILQYDDVVVSHWKKNTGYMWNSEVLHLAANCGLEDRYTLQISGFLT